MLRKQGATLSTTAEARVLLLVPPQCVVDSCVWAQVFWGVRLAAVATLAACGHAGLGLWWRVPSVCVAPEDAPPEDGHARK